MKRKNIRIPVICLAIAVASLSLAGCSSTNNEKNGKAGQTKEDAVNVSDAKENASAGGEKVSEDGEEDTLTEEAVRANAEFVVTPVYSEEELSADYEEEQAVQITLSGNTAVCSDESVQIENGMLTVTKSGTYVLNGTLDDGRIVVETEKDDKGIVRLVLDGAQITSMDGSAIYVKNAKETILTLKENTQNTITDAKEYSAENTAEGMKAAIYSKDDLTINGEGTLQVEAYYHHGIQSKDNLLFVSGTIGISSADDAVIGKDSVVIKDAALEIDTQGHGIKGTSNEAEKGYVYVENAKIDIQAAGDGIHADTVVQIDGGTLAITSQDDGIHADVKILLNGGNISVEDSYEGLEACRIILNDGDVKLHTSDDGINATNGADNFMGGGMQGGFRGGMRGDFNSSESNFSEEENWRKEGFEKAQEEMSGLTEEDLKGAQQTDKNTEQKDDLTGESSENRQNGRKKGTRPDMGDGQLKQTPDMSDGRMPQMPDGETPDMGNGQMPQMPDGEMPDMGNGQMPQMPDGETPDMGNNPFQQFSDSESQDSNTALQVLEPVVEINGGNLYINAGGDGLDSNGNVIMNGGSVIVDGPENDGNGAIDYEKTFEMKGGTLVAAGSSGMAMVTSDASTVNAVLVNFTNTYQNAKVVLKDSKGSEVISYTPVKKFNSIVFANELLKMGETYTVYIDGEEAEDFTVSQTVTTVGSAGVGGGFKGKN